MEIYEVPEGRRYWVVRADGGRFYENFVRYGVVALGHIDKLGYTETAPQEFQPDFTELAAELKGLSKHPRSRSAMAQTKQVRAFLYDMSIDDWVVTVGKGRLRIGRVTSDSYISHNTLTVIHDAQLGLQTDLEYQLRRDIDWGPSLNRRNSLPFGLQQALRANQTLFNVDQHWKSIYHTLYPYFKREDTLYLSAEISTVKSVKNHNLVAFQGMLDEFEVIAKEYEYAVAESEAEEVGSGNTTGAGLFNKTFWNTDYSTQQASLDSCIQEYKDKDWLTVTSKAHYHSPGEMWYEVVSTLVSDHSWMTPYVVSYSMLFGNRLLGFDGIIDKEMRHKLLDLILQRFEKTGVVLDVGQMELGVPSHETEVLEGKEPQKETVKNKPTAGKYSL